MHRAGRNQSENKVVPNCTVPAFIMLQHREGDRYGCGTCCIGHVYLCTVGRKPKFKQ